MAAAALALAVHVSPALASDRLDLVWRDASTHLVHVAGSTNTSFALWASWGSWSEYTDIKFADVNGDGIDDLVGRYPGGSVIKVNLSNGSSFRWGGTWDAGNVGNEPWHLADVTGDGKADIVWRDPAANAIMVGVSTGTQFQAPVEWTKWWGAGELKFGDFNGDGRADIVSRPYGGGTIAVGLATQSLASGISYDGNVGAWNNGEPWHLADVNGDGHDDFISRVPTENSIKVMTVEGVKFTAPMEWTKWYGSMDIKVGDVNGDGRADIVGRGGGQTRVGLARASVGSGITYGGAWETGPDRSEPWYLAEVRAPVRSVSGDMDGNGVANATVTSTATTRTYWHSDSGPNSTSLLGDGYAWGNPTDYPLLGDFDGNGRQQLGLYRPGTPSSWYYATDGGANSSDYLSSGLDLTLTGDIPLVGDFDGNDFDQIAVFRGGAFYFRKDVGPGSAGDDLINGGFRVGPNNEPTNGIPLVGDFDDNGHDNFAVFDRSTGLVHWRDDWGPGGNGVRHTIDTGAALNDGNPDNDLDIPLVGDMDGNGTANIVMYRPTAGAFYWQKDGGSAAPGYAHSWWTIVGFDAEHWYNYIPLLQDFDGNRRDNAAVYRRYNGRFLWKGDWGPGSVDGEKYLASAADTDVPRASTWAARQVVLHQSSWRYGGVNGVVDTPEEAQRTVGEIRSSAEGFNGPHHGLSPSDREYVRVWMDATWPTSRTFGGSNWKVDNDAEADAFIEAFRGAASDASAVALYNGVAEADRPFIDGRMRASVPDDSLIYDVADGQLWYIGQGDRDRVAPHYGPGLAAELGAAVRVSRGVVDSYVFGEEWTDPSIEDIDVTETQDEADSGLSLAWDAEWGEGTELYAGYAQQSVAPLVAVGLCVRFCPLAARTANVVGKLRKVSSASKIPARAIPAARSWAPNPTQLAQAFKNARGSNPGRTLGRNIEKRAKDRPGDAERRAARQRKNGFHAHHIVATGDRRAAFGRAVLQNCGTGPNDPANGVWLNDAQHRGLHTNAYFRNVNEALRPMWKLCDSSSSGTDNRLAMTLALKSIAFALQARQFPH